jgi:hypothetical protein
MAKLTRSGAKCAEGDPVFFKHGDLVSIGLSSNETHVTYHLHLNLAEAKELASYIREMTG